MKDDEIAAGAKLIAEYLTGPGGERVSFDAAVARYLSWFAAARERGLRWQSIASLLTQAGARRADGGAYTGSQISAVYSRQAMKSGGRVSTTPVAHLQQASRKSSQQRGDKVGLDHAPLGALQPERASRGVITHQGNQTEKTVLGQEMNPPGDDTRPEIDEIRERMRRATHIRARDRKDN